LKTIASLDETRHSSKRMAGIQRLAATIKWDSPRPEIAAFIQAFRREFDTPPA
jgi:hypothetical protein